MTPLGLAGGSQVTVTRVSVTFTTEMFRGASGTAACSTPAVSWQSAEPPLQSSACVDTLTLLDYTTGWYRKWTLRHWSQVDSPIQETEQGGGEGHGTQGTSCCFPINQNVPPTNSDVSRRPTQNHSFMVIRHTEIERPDTTLHDVGVYNLNHYDCFPKRSWYQLGFLVPFLRFSAFEIFLFRLMCTVPTSPHIARLLSWTKGASRSVAKALCSFAADMTLPRTGTSAAAVTPPPPPPDEDFSG